jgi:hypothetical protein
MSLKELREKLYPKQQNKPRTERPPDTSRSAYGEWCETAELNEEQKLPSYMEWVQMVWENYRAREAG